MSNIRNLIYGYIIGDSYGLSVLNTKDINDSIELRNNNELNIEKGNYSSMSVYMLATLDSISKCKKIDTIDILNKMCTSLIVGKYTSDGKIYDLDNNTVNILKHYSKKNNLNYEFDENDMSGYPLSRILPIAIYNYYKEDNLDDLTSLVSMTNINEEVLIGSYIYYKYLYNLLSGYDKYKALYKIEMPIGFNTKEINKFKHILKGNIYYKEIKKDNSIISVLSNVFYVVLNSNNFKDIFKMLNNMEGNTNIYGALIGAIGGIIYNVDSINELKLRIKNRKNISKYIRSFERIFKK